MIIKSMSRKEPSFAQLINYMTDIEKSDRKYHVYHNLFTRCDTQLKEAFQENAKCIKKRKNANYMYHEILSITKSKKLGIEDQKEALRRIAYAYTQMRARRNMVFGCLHNDHEDHLHYHLLISANEAGQAKKTRLSKAQFYQVKKQIEQRVLRHYPELEQTVIMSKDTYKTSETLSRKAGETKRRTGKMPQRDALKAKLTELFQQAHSKEVFFAALGEANLELYIRGKTIGVKDLQNDRKHRLKTLGLSAEFEACSKRIELDEIQKSSTTRRARKTAQSETTQEKQQSEKEKKQTKNTTSAKENAVSQARRQRKAEIKKMREQQSQSETQRKKS